VRPLAVSELFETPATLPQLLSLQARTRPHATFLVDSPGREARGLGRARRLSFAEADLRVGELAALFLELGLDPGDVVAVQLPNVAEQAMVLLGAWRAGLRTSVAPLLYRCAEIARAFAAEPPRAIVTAGRIGDYDHALAMRDLAAEYESVRHVLCVGEMAPDGVAPLDPLFDGEPFVHAVFENASAEQRDSLTLWTAHADRDVIPVRHRQRGLASLGALCADTFGLDANNRLLCPYPPSGIVGLAAGLSACLVSGASLHIHPPFDQRAFAEELAQSRATHLLAPSSAIGALAAEGALGSVAGLDAIACVWPGPRPAYPGLPLDMIAAQIFDVHALAQVALSIRRRRPGDDPALLKLGRIGETDATRDAVETRVRGSVRNGAASSRLVGALYVRGAAVTPQDESGLAFVDTGIACAVEEAAPGFIRCERDPQLIHHGGYAISALELDEAYASCPGLLDAVCVSLPDRIMGQRLVAAVAPQPGSAPSLEILIRHLTMRELAPYKFPDRLVIVTSIPRGADGRPLRDLALDRA
jgi:mycobactin salicyl-AMP ligase